MLLRATWLQDQFSGQSQGPGRGEKAGKVLPAWCLWWAPPGRTSSTLSQAAQASGGVLDARRSSAAASACPEPAGGRDPRLEVRCQGPAGPRTLPAGEDLGEICGPGEN